MCSRRQRLEGEDLAAAQQRRVDGEERVLRRGADEDDAALLHVGQQHVLLGAVEAVQLIDEEDGAPAGRPPARSGPPARSSRTSLMPAATALSGRKRQLRVLGDDVGQGGLAGAGRAVEDHAS